MPGRQRTAADIGDLLTHEGLTYLSEMMNVPGVLAEDPEIMAKIRLAQQYGCPIDGHAPGLRGAAVQRYTAAGITTDHECYTLEEAHDKIAAGMHILIREGSAAKNFPALHSLIASHPERCMFCSDDKHPDDLVCGHINEVVRWSVAMGYNVMDVLHIICVHPLHHYRLPVGLLHSGDPADIIVVNNLRDFQVLQTYRQGHLVAERGQALLPTVPMEPLNRFAATERCVEAFQLPVQYARLHARVKQLGSTLTAPCMTLAFMALLVIPDLKLSDRGLFSG